MSGPRSHLLKALILAAAFCAPHAHAQNPTCGLGPIQHIEKLPNGVRIHTAHGVEEITRSAPTSSAFASHPPHNSPKTHPGPSSPKLIAPPLPSRSTIP